MQPLCKDKESLFDVYSEKEELTKYKISNGRINYKYNDRVIIRELNPNTGNGYICGKFLEGDEYDTNKRGWINIKFFNKGEIKDLLEKAMISFLIYL
ncbi:MAG: hypothetical protein FH753_01200 [Firmicutes bacterium]|nr:hypothetical protein [Bacillota bacterium]